MQYNYQDIKVIVIIMSIFLECLSMWNILNCAEQVQIQKYKTHAKKDTLSSLVLNMLHHVVTDRMQLQLIQISKCVNWGKNLRNLKANIQKWKRYGRACVSLCVLVCVCGCVCVYLCLCVCVWFCVFVCAFLGMCMCRVSKDIFYLTVSCRNNCNFCSR